MDEADFILEILSHPEDETLRLVYADWLEERGDPRAEFLRMECELQKVRIEENEAVYTEVRGSIGRTNEYYLPRPSELADLIQRWELADAVDLLRKRLAELRIPISHRWLRWIDRTKIEKCYAPLALECPKQWDQLTLTTNDRVRHCNHCDREVYYCDSVAEAQELAQQQHCVAIASNLTRNPDNLREPAEDSIDVGMPDPDEFETALENAWKRLPKRTLSRLLVEQIRREAPSYWHADTEANKPSNE